MFSRGDLGFRNTHYAIIFSSRVIQLQHIKMGHCHKYRMKHHTLMHQEYNSNASTQHSEWQTNPCLSDIAPIQVSHCSLKHHDTQVVVLTTIIKVQGVGGQLHKWRSLLDSASQINFITEAMVNILGMQRRRNLSPLKGINSVAWDARSSVNIQLCSRYSKFQAEVMWFILLKITGNVPAQYFECDLW
jgi:hypothetical protein